MRRIVFLITPILIAAAVWILASDDNTEETTAEVSAATVESVQIALDEDAEEQTPPIATPRPPRKTRVGNPAESAEEPSADVMQKILPETESIEPVKSETVTTKAETTVSENVPRPVYTPRPPRKDTPTAGNAAAEPDATVVQPENSIEAGYELAAEETPAAVSGQSLKYIRQGKAGSKLVALTFDDGPNAEHTPRLLAYLRENNIPATFFLLGESIEKNPSVLIEMAEYGFEIGNHSYNHPSLSKANEQTIRLQLKNTSDLIQQHAGVTPVIMRPPFGNTGDTMKAICDEMGMDVILWSVDTNDWKPNRTVDGIMETVEKELKGGAIILMHDRLERTLEAVPRIVQLVNEKGYKLVTVSELVQELKNQNANAAGLGGN